MTKKVYFENLDGLRFFCFLSIFFFHSFHTDFDSIRSSITYQFIKFGIFGNGNLGVNFFFVLSGFLITYLLIEEKNLNGQINIGKFWIRRALRIWPLFYLCVAFGFFAFPILKSAFGQTPNETASIGYYLAFLNNFDFLKKGLPDASILGVLWSIAVEEQFYFLWPVLLYILPVRNYWIAFGLVMISSLLFRAFTNSAMLNEYHTLSCIGDMAVGALGAWLAVQRKSVVAMFTEMSKPVIACLYLSLLVVYFLRAELFYSNSIIMIFERQIIAFIILAIIMEQNYAKHSFFKLSKLKTVSRLGLITYGLYCLHFIGILVATNVTKKLGFNTHIAEVLLLDTSIALTITVIIGFISYKYYESPFLKLKRRFEFITR